MLCLGPKSVIRIISSDVLFEGFIEILNYLELYGPATLNFVQHFDVLFFGSGMSNMAEKVISR